MIYGKKFEADGGTSGGGSGAAAPAASNAGTQAGAAAPNSGGASQTNTPPDWTTGLNDEQKGYLQAKNVKDVTTLLEGYRGLEKHFGAPKEHILKLPKPDADPKEWGEVFTRLGKPEKADDYGITVPKEGGDPKFADWAKNTFHELHLTKDQAVGVVSKWNEFMKANEEEATKELATNSQQQKASLDKEWGQASKLNTELAKGAASQLGVSEAQIDALQKVLGYDGTYKFFHSIATKIGEDRFVNPEQRDGFGGALSPGAARIKKAELMQDPTFREKFLAGERKAVQEMQKLNQMIDPELSA